MNKKKKAVDKVAGLQRGKTTSGRHGSGGLVVGGGGGSGGGGGGGGGGTSGGSGGVATDIGALEKIVATQEEGVTAPESAVSKTGKFELAFPFNTEVAHAAMNMSDSGGLFGTKSAASKDPSWLQQQQQATKTVVKAIAQLERTARKMQKGIA